MRPMTPEEEIIYNEGERLIPEVTHDIGEFIRHRSSYIFFRNVIMHDLKKLKLPKDHPITILDLGCGVGHGCETLSEIPNSSVVGVDNSTTVLDYASRNYGAKNIDYRFVDIKSFLPTMPVYDYIVSRGVIEHIPDGLNLMLAAKYRYRLMFDVPYEEPAGPNPHHVIHNVREDSFPMFPSAEFYFEDLQGVIYDKKTKPAKPNMIMCVVSNRPDLHPITSKVSFPVRAWDPESRNKPRTIWQKIAAQFQS